jgi:hexosaminidase
MGAPIRRFLPMLLFCAAVGPVAAQQRHALMPVPASLQVSAARLPLDARFSVAIAAHSDARLRGAVERALTRLRSRTALRMPPTAVAGNSGTLVVEVRKASSPFPTLGDDESYSLRVSEHQAVLRAETTLGALRGLETLLQLVSGDRLGFYLPAVTIDDRPRFPWRGLLIDVARHWMPMEVVKRNIDGMAAVKLNVLHLHLTEDQGFRIESRKYPKLHQLGSDGLYFTQDQMRDIVRYAADRGIRVLPEFDMPGHATSWLVGHPELASAPGPYAIERKWGIFDPTLDPTRESTYRLLDGFLGEMAAVFPDAYMHIGGDENNGKQWASNGEIQAFMRQRGLPDAHALQARFNQRVAKILARHGKRMVGWDEILHPDLPHDIVVQSWRGQESLADGARKGYAGLLSNGYYLDYIYPAAQHYLVDPLPAGTVLTGEEQQRILGGEACMWAEFVSPDTIDSRIWPRMAAIAERFWSAREVRDVADMYRRLDVVSVQLEELGLLHNSGPAAMLRRLAGAGDASPLETLWAVIEPVKKYERPDLRPADQMMPLTRLVDAAVPDSRDTRRFAAALQRLLADHERRESGRSEVEGLLERWRDVHPELHVLIDASPALHEVRPLADDLVDAAEIGLQALAYLAAGGAPPAWKEAVSTRLDLAAKPKGELELAIVPALKALVAAAVGETTITY